MKKLFSKKKFVFSGFPKKKKKLKIKKRRLPKIGIETPNLHPKNYFFKFGALFYFSLLIAFFYFLFYLIFQSQLFNVNEIVFLNEIKNDKEEIKNEIKKLMDGKYLGIFNKRHFLFFHSTRIENFLKEKYKSIDQVRVARKFFGKLTVEIYEKKGVVIMCNLEKCASFDGNGVVVYVFGRADLYKFKEINEVIFDESNVQMKEGSGVNSSQYIDFVLNIREKIKEKNQIEIGSIYTPLPWASEISAKTKDGWLIFFETSDSMNDQLEALKVILEQELKNEDVACLEYIDLRVGNKVYYKMHDDCENFKENELNDDNDQENNS